jgi:hypothetical protein
MLLKKQDKFQWTQEAQEAFEDLKKHLKPCSSTYLLQVMWLVQLLSSNGGSWTPTARSNI